MVNDFLEVSDCLCRLMVLQMGNAAKIQDREAIRGALFVALRRFEGHKRFVGMAATDIPCRQDERNNHLAENWVRGMFATQFVGDLMSLIRVAGESDRERHNFQIRAVEK